MRRGAAFDTALERALGQLSDPDRRLTHELAAGVLRQRQGLDRLLARFIPRGLDSVSPPLLDVLRLGAYQIRLLDRVPPHAAVATSVGLARERVGERVTGFVNAVLRQVATLGPDHGTGHQPDSAARLASQYSHPHWLVVRWLARFGETDTERLLAWNNAVPSLVVQPARSTIGELEASFRSASVPCEPAPCQSGLVIGSVRSGTGPFPGEPRRRFAGTAAREGVGLRPPAPTRPNELPGFDEGAFFVQDPAQALVCRFAGFPPDALVYDACAAPGGKALALARRARVVIAADISRRRLDRVRQNVARAGRGNERLLVADAARPPIRSVKAYLLDAPCMATGSFARHPDARHRIREEAIGPLTAMQSRLLEAAADRIARGGVLCYATCSLEPEENEDRIAAFLERHPDFRREPPGDFPPELLTPAGDLATFPHRDGMDGAFAARLVRLA